MDTQLVELTAGPKPRAWLIRRLPRIATVTSYTLDNGFVGRACKPIADYATETPGPWGWLADSLKKLSPSVRVYLPANGRGNAHVTVRFHSNDWLRVTFDKTHYVIHRDCSELADLLRVKESA